MFPDALPDPTKPGQMVGTQMQSHRAFWIEQSDQWLVRKTAGWTQRWRRHRRQVGGRRHLQTPCARRPSIHRQSWRTLRSCLTLLPRQKGLPPLAWTTIFPGFWRRHVRWFYPLLLPIHPHQAYVCAVGEVAYERPVKLRESSRHAGRGRFSTRGPFARR